jgi:hypothetical protein
VTPSSRKELSTVFCNHEGILLTAFQPQRYTVNADSYCKILRKLRKVIQRKRLELAGPGKSPPKEFDDAGSQGLVKRREKCLNIHADYVEE